MDLSIDPIQERLAEAVDTVLTRTGAPYAELAAIGVPGLSIREEFGGLELGLSADTMVNDRLGYALEPLGAYRETVLALDLLDPRNVPDSLLSDLVKGTRHAVTVGVHTEPSVRADAEGRLHGVSECLPVGEIGAAVVRTARPDGGTGWHLVFPAGPECRVRDADRMGLPQLRLVLEAAEGLSLSGVDERWETALNSARVRQAALLLGLARRAVDEARAHVNSRIQYGKPLVELQTVAHGLARISGEGDGWDLLAHETAWQCDNGRARTADTALLLATAAEHALLATRKCLQLHGVRGMLGHSTPAAAYRLAAVEGLRMGTPAQLWRLAAPGWRR
ncbi:acyl-CoA dehydrogenase family protein [Nocardiopsis valliformis]|uniref:acyl-CoA dehydrogenase family protein n=1 Tax=Nocardiopsis valliformis TaxID=239974 RepID=UPI00034CEE98|nr:acyl-CoA dehydrogenase family protein [Nocardiopsis valliformis]